MAAPTKFTLTIELGNDAMRSAAHLRTVLVEVTRAIDGPLRADTKKIRDINGNTVGSWTLE